MNTVRDIMLGVGQILLGWAFCITVGMLMVWAIISFFPQITRP